MFNISYKMEADEIKDVIRANYMQTVNNHVMSGEYFKNRNKRIFRMFLYSTLCILIDCLLWKHRIPYTFDTYTGFTLIYTSLVFITIPMIILFQIDNFGRDIKKQCIKGILQDLANIKYLNYKEEKNITNTISDNDIMDFNLTEKFNSKYACDIFVGDYNDINYNLQEIKLYRGYGKSKTLEFEGAVLKVKLNTLINGWIDISNKCIKKPETLLGNFVGYLIVLNIIIFMFKDFISLIPYPQYGYAIIFILSCIASYFFAKNTVAKDIAKANIEKRQLRESDLEYINEKLSIKASDNIENINDIITTDLVDVIEKIQKLLNTSKVHCKLYSDKVMLAIDNHENMFELGDLFTPPTNKKVADKFISQISGVLLFLDYLDNKKM